MIEITNETIGGNVSYTNGEYRTQGDYRVNPETKKVDTLNVSVNRNEAYAGNVNIYTNGTEQQVNYNSMKQSDVAEVSTEITALIGELENRYSSVTLMTAEQ